MTRLLRDDRAMGGLEALPFGVLVFVVGALVVANAWAVVDAKGAVTAAAREATRAFVEAPDASTAMAAAVRAAEEAMVGQGRSARPPDVALVEGSFRRCDRVLIEVRYEVPTVRLPWLGAAGPAMEVVGRHSEVVDPYRSGTFPDGGGCP